jgi:hypothetical protein
MAICLSCLKENKVDQPTFCESCFIPVPFPKLRQKDDLYYLRETNRVKLAQEIVDKTPGAMDFINDLGLNHLKIEDLAVALSAIGMEKLHFYSSEYNWSEAQTLIDLGYGISQILKEPWVHEITSIRLAYQEIRGGWVELARDRLLTYQHRSIGNNIEKYDSSPEVVTAFQNLEIKAYLALSNSFLSLESNTSELQDQVLYFWELMKDQIKDIIVNKVQSSFYLGLKDSAFKVPRLDKLAFIQTILIYEAIAKSTNHISNEVLEKFMILGRMCIILGEMSPQDDPPFYSALIREYFLLFNGLFWYEEALKENDLDLVQKSILQAHAICLQWMYIIPPSYWIDVRPSRFLEIYYRSTIWYDQLSPELFIKFWLDNLPNEIKPYGNYLVAEAQINTGLQAQAEENLLNIIDNKHSDDQLKSFARDLIQKSLLEYDGIVLENKFKSSLDSLLVIIELPPGKTSTDDSSKNKELTLNQLKDKFEDEFQMTNIRLPNPESLMMINFKPINDLIDKSISVFSEKFEEIIFNTPNIKNQHFNQSIQVLGSKYYKDIHWQTPFEAISKKIVGIRTDVVVFNIKLDERYLALLFEAGKIPIEDTEKHIVIGSPTLYYLVGFASDKDLTPEILLEILSNLLNQELKFLQMDIYTLLLDL